MLQKNILADFSAVCENPTFVSFIGGQKLKMVSIFKSIIIPLVLNLLFSCLVDFIFEIK
jgi:hypothetical protein